MDFFSQQDKARRSSSVLVGLFVLAVVGLIAITNVLIALVLWFFTQDDTMQRGLGVITQTDTSTIEALFSWHSFALVSLGVVGAVFVAIGYKAWQLSAGGKAVAESLGGQRIHPNTEDPNQRQALNVIEEMALASGMPVPAVYLLEHEMGINAFAAGNSPSDAVIGVTRGCIEQFKRDELQGVIAHEFSHILNGDMRLNLRLIALLHGIVFIGFVGEMLLRGGSSRRKSGGRIALLGLALLVIGWLGTFFGNLIKAAVSRQREFLADASAVQFTRNPEGIGNALKVLGAHQSGSEVLNQHRSEVSHLFFGQAVSKIAGMFATHPPLVDRILSIDPDWDGNYIYRGEETRVKKQKEDQATLEEKREQFARVVLTGAAVAAGVDPEQVFSMSDDLDQVRIEIDGVPEFVHEQAHEPLGAIGLCFALLLHDEDELQKQQLVYILESQFPGIDVLVKRLRQELIPMPMSYRLPLIEMLLPALMCMSEAQYRSFKRCLMQLIRTDKQTDLFEWCLFQLVQHYLAPEFGGVNKRKPEHKEASQVAEAYQLVLSLVAHYGHDNEKDTESAFHRGANAAGLYTITLLPEVDCDIGQFGKAVGELGAAYPMLKPRLLTGLRLCVQQDGVVSIEEREVLSAIAAVMDSPVPMFEEKLFEEKVLEEKLFEEKVLEEK